MPNSSQVSPLIKHLSPERILSGGSSAQKVPESMNRLSGSKPNLEIIEENARES